MASIIRDNQAPRVVPLCPLRLQRILFLCLICVFQMIHIGVGNRAEYITPTIYLIPGLRKRVLCFDLVCFILALFVIIMYVYAGF